MPVFFSASCVPSDPFHSDENFFNKPLESNSKDVRLLVKHVFITSDLGEYGLPKWASWVRVVIDGTFMLKSSGLAC